MRSAALQTLLLLLILTTSSEAQGAVPGVRGPRPSQILSVVPRGPLHQAFVPDSVRHRIRPTYWKQGAFIGGLTAGLGLALFIAGLCHDSDTSNNCGSALTGGFLVGGVIGGVSGALIGGQFPQDEDD
jgi:hypothetical protein